MLAFFGDITKSYGWELVLLNKTRNFNDGLTLFVFVMNWDRYEGDHSPRFELSLILFNIYIFDFSIYYLKHRSKK